MLVALLATVMTAIVASYADENQLVDRSGKQRMFSQLIAFDVVYAGTNPAEARREFERNARDFIDAQRLLDTRSDDIPLTRLVEEYVASARAAIAPGASALAREAFLTRRLPMLANLDAEVRDRVERDGVRRQRFTGSLIAAFFFLLAGIWIAWRLVVRPFEVTVLAERERFRSLFDRNSDAIFMLDVDGGIELANDAARTMLGRTNAEVAGRSIRDVLVNAEAADGDRTFTALLAGDDATFDTTFVGAGGKRVLMSGRSVPIVVEGRVVGIFAVGRDITIDRERERTMLMLATALDNAGDLVMMTDTTPVAAGGPLITYANRAYLAEFGYALEEIVGRSPAIFYGPGTDRAVIGQIAKDIGNGKPAGSTFLAYRRDGTAFHVEMYGRPIADADGSRSGWVAVGRDVSERRKQNENLIALRTAVDEANDRVIVFAIDPTGRRRNGRAMYVNAAAVRSSGFTTEELLREPLRVTSASQADLDMLHETIARGTPVRTRLEMCHADGSPYWGEIDARPVFDAAGTLTHWISIERDVSETVRREGELAAEKSTLDALLAVVREMFATFSSDDLESVMLAGVKRVFDARATIHEDAGDDGLLQVAMRGGGVAFDQREGRAAFAVPSLHVGRRSLIVDINDIDEERATQNDMYAMQLFAETFVAATYNVALYDELSARREAIGEINQTKSDLIAMLAHDLKNPLTTIMGYAELVEEGALAGEDASFAMRAILKATQRLTALANDTLALARLERNDLDVEVEPVEFRAIVADAIAQHRDERTIRFESPERGVNGFGDASRLRQVFENLISNAIKYSPKGEPVEVALGADGRYVTVTIADRGIGIPENEKQYVFERFARASNAQASKITGTGFGLYLVRAIAEQHGGTVTVDDRDGGGTMFTVRLPQRMQPQATLMPTIVVVDPTGDVASSAAQALRENGFRTRVIRRLTQIPTAVERAEARLVVIDIDAVARAEHCNPNQLRGIDYGVATICIASQTRDIAIACQATIAKPYLESDFIGAVRTLLAKPETIPEALV